MLTARMELFMSQPEKKLAKFTSAVLKDAEEQRSKILNEIDVYRKAQIEKAEEEILNDAYVMIQNEIALIKNKNSRQISLSELESRRKLLKLRDEISRGVFEDAARSLLDFTATSKYIDYICNLIKKCVETFPAGKSVIMVKKEDLQYKDNLLSTFGRDDAACEASVNITIGGVIIYNHDKGIVVDETLDLKLESQKDWFAATSGLTIG
jgi:V/A-type H+-transporting ATPase subunit E